MTTKPINTKSALPRLFDAVQDIVTGTRGVIDKTSGGGQNAALHIPVHFAGTDMRVTIEAGPGIAALNAIQGAQMQASGKPATSLTMPITEAMTLLALHAAELRLADKGTDGKRKSDIENIVRVISDLEALKGRLAATPPKEPQA